MFKMLLTFILLLGLSTAWGMGHADRVTLPVPQNSNPIEKGIPYYSGFYIGLQFAGTDVDYSKNFKGAGASSVDNNVLGIRASAGFDFFRYFGAEVAYTDYGRIKFHNVGGEAGFDPKLNQSAIEGLLKLQIPIKSRGLVYVKPGLARVFHGSLSTVTGSDNTNQWETAVGGDFVLTDHILIDGTWLHVYQRGGFPDMDFIGGGLIYRFGNLSLPYPIHHE